jgi:hypothetical protein
MAEKTERYGNLVTGQELLFYDILQELRAIRELLTPKEVTQNAKQTELRTRSQKSISNSAGSGGDNAK